MLRTHVWAKVAPIAVTAAALALLGGCSDSSGNDGNVGTAGTGGSGTGGNGGEASGGTGGTPVECDDGPGYAEPLNQRKVTLVKARVVDTDGAPIGDLAIQVCGTDICYFGKTNDKGIVTSCTNDICSEGVKPPSALNKPAFKHGSGIDYARFAFLLPEGQTEYDLGDVPALKLPAPGTGDALTPGQTATSNGIEVTLAADAGLRVEGYFDDEEMQFRADCMDLSEAPEAVDTTLGLEMLIGIGPIEVKICPAASMSVPNNENWEPGTEVEFLLHGIDITEEWAPYAGWAVVSTGAVSADGNSIVTTEGEGIPQLSVIGIRRKP